jgi:hypothetical protein
MQGRYAGDIGDFVKLGLLRHIVRGCHNDVRVGINWYLRPDELDHNDGNHVDYLLPHHKHAASLQELDAQLYESMAAVVAGTRTIQSYVDNGAVPGEWAGFSEWVPCANNEVRHEWQEHALSVLGTSDVIYLDPDNGLNWSSPRLSPKHAQLSEVAEYLGNGQSVIAYQHADRSPGGVRAQVLRRLSRLHEISDVRPLGGMIARRGSCRWFAVVPASHHRRILREGLTSFADEWADHAEFVPYR